MERLTLDDFEEGRGSYDSSYAYLFVKNELTRKEQTFCVNYEQWQTQQIANDVKNAEVLRLGWWGGIVNNTNVCNKGKSVLMEKKAVALNYRLKIEDGRCAIPFIMKNTSFKKALQYEVNELASSHASVAIMLVDKGQKYIAKWADYLFSEFYDPDFNQSTKLPTFFMYRTAFFDEMLNLSNDRSGKELLLQFYRPMNSRWDISMLIVWIIALFCVTVGGYWAALRKIYEEANTFHGSQQIPTADSQVQKSRSWLNNNQTTFSTNCLFIIIVMFIVVGVLMLGFYFRGIMVFIFNIILTTIGTFSIHRCLTALFGSVCKCGHCRICISMNDVTHSVFRRDLFNYDCCTERPLVMSVMIFLCAASFCICWLIFRRHPYAFLLLDFINIAVCIHILKGIRFPNLMWLTVLLMCMFIYDMFMVFITPFLTENGCSVMIEVAAGTDCSKAAGGYPVAPISTGIPEKFPMLFQVPRLSDPMISCIDLEIEKEFHPVILGLGDVIIPGYLICFCFTVDFVVRTRYLYGFISIIGYGIGLFVTFIALTLMEIAQPALIYLIPFTLGPIIMLALIRREFKLLWIGDFAKSEVTNANSHLSQNSAVDTASSGFNSGSNGFDAVTPLPITSPSNANQREI
uniref:Signal peptide peptidase-like 2B n=1 Tax=Elaeophora elaphi TaxID=1147741 RepID=A0A0R3RVA0_9BILA